MKGQRIGYVRVSTIEQNTARQLEGIAVDKTFQDKASGKDVQRPALVELLRFVREGDLVIVHSMDRLARNLDDLRRIVKELTSKGVRIQFVKESLTFTGEDSPMSTLLLSMMGAFAEFERALIKERQMEGIAIAKREGRYKGRKKKLSAEQVKNVKERIAQGDKKATIAREFKVSRATLYQYLMG
jgi:DNA invertase Pin-like site-specific DNA recombinase